MFQQTTVSYSAHPDCQDMRLRRQKPTRKKAEAYFSFYTKSLNDVRTEPEVRFYKS